MQTGQIMKAQNGNNDEARNLALRLQADVIIAGKVYTEELPQNEYFEGTNWVSSKAYISLRTIIAKTGEILEVNGIEQYGTGLTYHDAGSKAIMQCSRKIANGLIWSIPLHIGATQEKTVQRVKKHEKCYECFPKRMEKQWPLYY